MALELGFDSARQADRARGLAFGGGLGRCRVGERAPGAGERGRDRRGRPLPTLQVPALGQPIDPLGTRMIVIFLQPVMQLRVARAIGGRVALQADARPTFRPADELLALLLPETPLYFPVWNKVQQPLE